MRFIPRQTKFYKSKYWKQKRAQVLKAQPLCQNCLSFGILEPAKVVDHIKPITKREDLFCPESNLQGLCKSCHSKKTGSEVAHYKSEKQKQKAIERKTAITFA